MMDHPPSDYKTWHPRNSDFTASMNAAALSPMMNRSPSSASSSSYPNFRTGTSQRGPPSVSESMASQNSLSPSTRELFRGMMKSSKLSPLQQRMLDKLVTNGYSLPSNPLPGMTGRENSTSSSTPTPGSEPPPLAPIKRRPIPTKYDRPAIRTLNQIIETDAFDTEVYRPKPQKDGVAEKKKLQVFMESDGKRRAAANGNFLENGDDFEEEQGKGGVVEEEEMDEFDMLTKEIAERKQWLDDMIALGRGDKYKRQISQEIQNRIKRLEQIDKVKTAIENAKRLSKAA